MIFCPDTDILLYLDSNTFQSKNWLVFMCHVKTDWHEKCRVKIKAHSNSHWQNYFLWAEVIHNIFSHKRSNALGEESIGDVHGLHKTFNRIVMCIWTRNTAYIAPNHIKPRQKPTLKLFKAETINDLDKWSPAELLAFHTCIEISMF